MKEKKIQTHEVFFFIYFLLKRVKRSFKLVALRRRRRAVKNEKTKKWKCHFCFCHYGKGWASYILFTATSTASTKRKRERKRDTRRKGEKTKKKVIITRFCNVVREKGRRTQRKFFAIFLHSCL